MFYTVMTRHDTLGWTLKQPYGDVRSAVASKKESNAEGRQAVIVKTDDLKGLSKARAMCNSFYMRTPKRAVLDFTEAGIATALLKTTK